MEAIFTPEELEERVAEHIRSLRLQKNMTRETLAARAGVSLTALRHLETGAGANLSTLIRTVRALDRQDWLLSIAPAITLNPLHMRPARGLRQRARRSHKNHAASQ